MPGVHARAPIWMAEVIDGASPLSVVSDPVPRITSLLIKPASSICNLDCEYCFYLDRSLDPTRDLKSRVMSAETLDRLMDGYLAYSYPRSTFAFQGGEPTLAGVEFFRAVVASQQRHHRGGQQVSNSIQTNGILLDKNWCAFFREQGFLVGLSVDGPAEVHDRYRYNKSRAPTANRVLAALKLLQEEQVEFNVLCVVSKANVGRPDEIYHFFRDHGVAQLQFIPLAEFHPDGTPRPFTVTPDEYGDFLCRVFERWWPERRDVRIRLFDNIAEALAGWKPGCCTLHESCDSYAVVESNGDVYPCDFFVESWWKLGNIQHDSWPEIARRQRRASFASKKSVLHAECSVCTYRHICHGGCPKLRHAARGRFEDLDWFCGAYKKIFAKAVAPLEDDVREIMAGMPRPRGVHPL